MEIEIIDNSPKVKEELEAVVLRALEKCGLTAEGYAKLLCPVDTGLLRNSIAHAISGGPAKIGKDGKSTYEADRPDKTGEKRKGAYSGTAPSGSNGEMSVYIGTNVEYSAHQELGAGKHYDGGRKTKWTYKDAKGQQHMTGGNTAKPFLKPAIADHVQTYRKTIEDELHG